MSKNSILERFEGVGIDSSWSFEGKTRTDTAYITHGYHRYPAKFIPQIVSKITDQYTDEGALIVDPFGGCGTTVVESKVMRRRSIGVDINPVAVLLAKVKKTPLDQSDIEREYVVLKNFMDAYDGVPVNGRLFYDGHRDGDSMVHVPNHPRIDYWFRENEKLKLHSLFLEISNIEDSDVQDFFTCGFSNILKNCSVWMQKSNKPTRDLKKKPSDPFVAFKRQMNMMLKGNREFTEILTENDSLDIDCDLYCADARDLPIGTHSVDLIITSPPYVTSYEYADLHQLTALWLGYMNDLRDFRKRFIGSAYYESHKQDMDSDIAESIVRDLQSDYRKIAADVAVYFSDMCNVFREMHRIVKKGGRACIVIGNTKLKGVDILNAEVFMEQMCRIGFEVEDIIKREIPSKNLPSMRDKRTGRFTSSKNKDKVLVYPTEYILVMRKI